MPTKRKDHNVVSPTFYGKKCTMCGVTLSFDNTILSRAKKGALQCRSCYIKARQTRQINYRKEVIQKLGGKCVECGIDDWRVLQIDHIHGKGNKERKKKGFHRLVYYKKLIKLPLEEIKKKYQLLCANHNWIKAYENYEFFQ